jgi:hypothetical protein
MGESENIPVSPRPRVFASSRLFSSFRLAVSLSVLGLLFLIAAALHLIARSQAFSEAGRCCWLPSFVTNLPGCDEMQESQFPGWLVVRVASGIQECDLSSGRVSCASR